MTNKTNTTKTYTAYSLNENKVKVYFRNEDTTVMEITCKPSLKLFELSKAVDSDSIDAIGADNIKFQTVTAYENEQARNEVKAVQTTNRASIKEVRTVLSLATKLNSTLAIKNSTQWDKAIAYYNDFFGSEQVGKREIKRRINELVSSVVTLEGTFDSE